MVMGKNFAGFTVASSHRLKWNVRQFDGGPVVVTGASECRQHVYCTLIKAGYEDYKVVNPRKQNTFNLWGRPH